uniref:Protein BEAN1-like n=1 Tax=Crocodylus porosus TaxID=8502 RepID=A0A7M4FU66_CROPO
MNKPSPCPSTCEFPSYSGNGNDTSLLVSPLLVAGVVIGLVLFLSCVTIIVGSLRKDGRLRHPYMRRDANYVLYIHRQLLTQEFPKTAPSDPCTYQRDTELVILPCKNSESLNVFSFSYDECVGPGATQIYIPTDDPPPYSLRDPCRRNDFSINIREVLPAKCLPMQPSRGAPGAPASGGFPPQGSPGLEQPQGAEGNSSPSELLALAPASLG